MKKRIYDLIVTPFKTQGQGIQGLPFLDDRVYLSVPADSSLAEYNSISLRDIPAQPLLYPQIGGYFLAQFDKLISENDLPITMVKNEYNITQYLIQTTNFLTTISTLSMDLRNDGMHRTLIPIDDPELSVVWHVSFLKSNIEKTRKFLEWIECIEPPKS